MVIVDEEMFSCFQGDHVVILIKFLFLTFLNDSIYLCQSLFSYYFSFLSYRRGGGGSVVKCVGQRYLGRARGKTLT